MMILSINPGLPSTSITAGNRNVRRLFAAARLRAIDLVRRTADVAAAPSRTHAHNASEPLPDNDRRRYCNLCTVSSGRSGKACATFRLPRAGIVIAHDEIAAYRRCVNQRSFITTAGWLVGCSAMPARLLLPAALGWSFPRRRRQAYLRASPWQ